MNSLLVESALPKLADFRDDEVKSAIDDVLEKSEVTVKKVLTCENKNWNTIQLLEEADEKVTQVFSSMSHMNAVQNSDALRENYEYAVEKITEFYTKLGQNKDLYELYKTVNKTNLNSEQKQAVKKALMEFEKSGVSLELSKRQRLQEISQELAQLHNKFENNVLDATMAWSYTTNDVNELKGLSKSVIESAEKKAQDKKSTKKYMLGLDAPTYIAVLQQCENSDLREIFYRAYCTKASEFGDDKSLNNDENIEKILKLRIEKSEILGFDSYAEYSLFSKMAETPKQVLELLNGLLDKSKDQAKIELEELKTFAKENGLSTEFKPWDSAFYAEKLKKAKYDFTAEELREYFPLEKVQSGLFTILNKIYGLEITENTTEPKYNEEVRIFEFSKNGELVGSIICDYFARDHKRGGAWMDGSRTAFVDINGKKQIPVAYVNGNFRPPAEHGANLTHNAVVTLFHEFGHALHHILSQVTVPSISGTQGVEWDAVELPSQFMENFCWCEEGLELISGTRSGTKLNQEQLNKLVGTRHFQSALAMVRQLEFSIFDMNIHAKKITNVIDVQKELDEVRAKINLSKTPEYNKFQNGFAHIFAGGYAAGYYSYKWAEILSSDVFSRFENEGVFSAKVGAELLDNIIAKGSSRDAMDNFVGFMSRKPNEDALLRHCGIK